jgi:Tol biopolymer transport system component
MIFPSPEQGYFLPREWTNSDRILVSHVLETGETPYQLGWISIEEKDWHDLPLSAGSSGYGCDTGASWSPEGDQIAIAGLEYGQPCNLNPGLTMINIDGGAAKRVIDFAISTGEEGGNMVRAGAHTPAWSPDGQWIAFGLDQDASAPSVFPTRLYRSRPDGSDLVPLTDNMQGVAAYPVWSADGKLYYSKNGVSAGTDGINLYDPENNTYTPLIKGSGMHPLNISPDGEFLVYEQDGGLVIWGFLREESILAVSGDSDSPATFAGWLDLNE